MTRDEIEWLYRCVLGREPDPSGVDAHLASGMSFAEARHSFLSSPEFESQHLSRNLAKETIYRPAPSRPAPIPFVALACIAKNEAEHIEAMLASCCDLISYVSMVDTGSTDNTNQIASDLLAAREIPLKLVEEPFRNFSQARNLSLDGVPDDADWILVLDADERIMPEDHWRFRQLLKAGPKIEGWRLPRFHFLDRAKLLPTMDYPDYQNRLFRNIPDRKVRYEGKVHECVTNIRRWGHAPPADADGTGDRGGPHIHHMGVITVEEKNVRVQKEQFYASLLS